MLRVPRFAGFLYPESPSVLRDSISSHLEKAPKLDFSGSIRALIVPHASFRYSLTSAGMAYAVLAAQHQTITHILLLGSSHRHNFSGIALPVDSGFKSPLGNSPISEKMLALALAIPGITRRGGVHDNEPSLEIQLPYLQILFPKAEILPMIIGNCPMAVASEIIDVFSHSPNHLIVVSSDLSHHYPYLNAKCLDKETATRILNLESTLTDHEACAHAWINGLTHLATIRGWTPQLLDIRNSGDEGGDTERVIGMGAFAFTDS